MLTAEADRVRIMPQPAAAVIKTIAERYVVGSFDVRIPVQTAAAILPGEEDTLAILKARLEAMSQSSRWHPVLLRYIQYVASRVQGLGGNPNQIPPSFGGAPIGVIVDGEHRREGRQYTGKICGLLFDHFGDFEGFLLDIGRREHRFDSRARDVRGLTERAWREQLRITVIPEPEEPDQIRGIVIHEPPAPFS